jgi:hypothetical protein
MGLGGRMAKYERLEDVPNFICNIDEVASNADGLHANQWVRAGIPEYKSKEFNEWLSKNEMVLRDFKETEMYAWAEKHGLIKDDEWTGEFNPSP